MDIYGGMKLAAGGELGMGVGEEDWGSSERDVLEDFARRTEGLVDVMVSRFGEASPLQQAKSLTDSKLLEMYEEESWVGSGKNVNAADGVVFSGLGAVSRKSLRDLSHWIETIYSHGEHAYGVQDTVTSDRKKRRRKNPRTESNTSTSKLPASVRKDRPIHSATNSSSAISPGIPPPIVKAAQSSLERASAAVEKFAVDGEDTPNSDSKPMLGSLGDTETWMKYMTLGYGTAWGGGKKTAEDAQAEAPYSQPPARERSPSPEAMRYVDPEPDVDVAGEKVKLQIQLENDGYFIIGLKGDMRDLDVDDDNEDGNWNNRIPLRTVHAEVDRQNSLLTPSVEEVEAPQYMREMNLRTGTQSKLCRLRPVVYVVSVASI